MNWDCKKRNQVRSAVGALLLVCPCFCPAGDRVGPAALLVPLEVRDPWFGRDKAQHFVVSFLVTGAVGYTAHAKWDCTRAESVNTAVGFTISLGCLKEIRDDWRSHSQASWKDLFADLLGTVAGVLLVSWW